MLLDKENLNVTYILKKNSLGNSIVYCDNKEIGEIHETIEMTYVLISNKEEKWILSPKVHGEIRPFSMSVLKSDLVSDKTNEVLVIHSHLFKHKNNFYMINITPEGMPLRETLKGPKYICRLKHSPVSNIEEIDQKSKIRLRWLRGFPVGEIEGIGTNGHKIKLSNELKDIALPLATSCHLMFAIF